MFVFNLAFYRVAVRRLGRRTLWPIIFINNSETRSLEPVCIE
jgi:hypothetical protein